MLALTQGDFLKHVTGGLVSCRRACLAVAFVTKAGLDLIRGSLAAALTAGADVRIVLDLSSGSTDPSAVWDLVQLMEQNQGLKVRTFMPSGNHRLHCKLFLFFSAGERVLLVTGSANLTEPGLTGNFEHGLAVVGLGNDEIIATSMAFFEKIWASSQTKPIDREVARLYEDFCGRQRVLQNRAHKRARGSWIRLENYLSSSPTPTSVAWPSTDIAYVLGVICARGQFEDHEQRIAIRLRFKAGSYPNGEIKVGNTAFKAKDVIPKIPRHIAERIKAVVPGGTVSVQGLTIGVDLKLAGTAYSVLRQPLGPATDPTEFRVPKELWTCDEATVTEFVRGVAVASGLVTNATSLPPHPVTGQPGIQTVWLRPQTGNKKLFDDLHNLIEQRLGIPVYTQWREYREPHLKIRCEDFQQIGFGLDWWDQLVAAGAQYNEMAYSST